MNPVKIGRFTIPFIGVCLFVFVLHTIRDLIIPVVIALVIFFIILMIASWYRHLPVVGNSINKGVALVLAFLTLGLFFYLFGGFISKSIDQVPVIYPDYQRKIQTLIRDTADNLDIKLPENWQQAVTSIDLVGFSTQFGQKVIITASNIFLIIFYLIFLFFEYAVFDKKMESAFPRKIHRRQATALFNKIARDISTYFRLKSAISFLTGFLSYIVLKGFEVDLAEFWAILIFFLNFIPNVGSIIAVIFPMIISLVQFQADAFYGVLSFQFIVISTLLISIQLFMGNVVEPKWLGNTLNLSPLVILISLTIWGSLWGIVGMFFSVPIMVILNIILANFEKTRRIAIFLSQNGKV